MKNGERPLDAGAAAEYLRKKWGLASFSIDAFRQHRRRHSIKPSVYPEMPNSTLWTREELDEIPRPDERMRREPREPRSRSEDLDIPDQAMVRYA